MADSTCMRLPCVFTVTEEEWRQLQWAGTKTVDGEPRLFQLNEILAKRNAPALGLFDGSLIQEQDAHRELQDLRDKVRALTEELAEANEAATVALNRHSDTCDGELAKLREALEKERASSRRLADLNFEMKGTIAALRKQLAASSLVPRKLAAAISAEEFEQVKRSLLYVMRGLSTGTWAQTIDAELSVLEKALGGV